MKRSMQDLFAATIVESIPHDEALDVVRQLNEEGGSPREKLVVAYDSGAAEGARRSYEILRREANAADEEMVTMVERIDVEISQAIEPEAVAVLQTIREPMAGYLAAKRKKHLEAIHRIICGDSSVITPEILAGAPASDEAYTILAVAAISTDPASYGGWLAYGDDKTMQCACPKCLGTRWRDAGNGLKEMRLIAARDERDVEATAQRMVDFGQHIAKVMRQHYDRLVSKLVRAPKAPEVADAKLAGQQAQDIMAGIMGKPKKE